ncbi:MAG: hypothetical protein COV74_10190 [Candidatus Omnitrophica bacterium CG11_big_fil_rev_8_21_14_0_20_45_26]|uniref:DUF5666 domain-containing protein n=1 Tax=Candidatus Abzuiibacterium crystallinum TaxID=1974748 RepID=A0A2H0LKP2_9BACT|nr:MAG: hypothetical protein COV74_10190 [Candidatus Omnitrophica bacterium CG11_big_fil_rev_8_21_14_0_20_45_26]PIW63959.1 MAG: hypothetical protein COW12_08630 [Candidatus Omnitrophica bacterium CG12_big_fil_rev_8_21_14_0_65_45_16]
MLRFNRYLSVAIFIMLIMTLSHPAFAINKDTDMLGLVSSTKLNSGTAANGLPRIGEIKIQGQVIGLSSVRVGMIEVTEKTRFEKNNKKLGAKEGFNYLKRGMGIEVVFDRKTTDLKVYPVTATAVRVEIFESEGGDKKKLF